MLSGKPTRVNRPERESRDFKMLPAPRTEHCTPSARLTVGDDDSGRHGADFKTGIGVYQAIVEYQLHARWWVNHDDLELLRRAASEFIRSLELRIKDGRYMGVPLIRIEKMNVRTVGAYRAEADGYAIPGTIGLNQERLHSMPCFMKLIILLKFLLCARQHQAGGDGSFDRDCRATLSALGLAISDLGAITVDEDGAFRKLLMSWGIDVPVASTLPQADRKPKSTLTLWSCTCQKARVGTREFFAVCTQCGEPFRIGDHVGKRFVNVDDATMPACRARHEGDPLGRSAVVPPAVLKTTD
jgi:hypothetical protein